MARIEVKRVYDAPGPEDGVRILVDRLWPRGLTKEAGSLEEWRRDLAPSDELRRWFGHQPERWQEFKARYRQELALAGKDGELRSLAARSAQEKTTLLFAAADREHNNAVALREFLEEWRGPPRPLSVGSLARPPSGGPSRP